MNAFFPGFEREQIQVSGASINRGHGGGALDRGHCLPQEQPEEAARQLESCLH